MDKLERDFYSIEQTDDGKKRVHVFGYVYDSEDGTDKSYRLVEFTFMYIPIPSEIPFKEAYEAAYNESKQYISDLSEGDASVLLDNFFDCEPTELAYEEITADTPCGYYIQP